MRGARCLRGSSVLLGLRSRAGCGPRERMLWRRALPLQRDAVGAQLCAGALPLRSFASVRVAAVAPISSSFPLLRLAGRRAPTSAWACRELPLARVGRFSDEILVLGQRSPGVVLAPDLLVERASCVRGNIALRSNTRRLRALLGSWWCRARLSLRRRMNNELNFPPNFERLVLGCIDADFCK